MTVRGEGPIPARVMLIGEAPGEQEERTGLPFQGASGQELNRLLHEAGIMRSECFTTNVCRVRPPHNDISHFIAQTKKERTNEHIQLRDKFVLPPVASGHAALLVEVKAVNPNLIITFGNLSMWSLTGRWGVTKWRGSMLTSDTGCKLIPTIHPAAVLREWSWRAAVVQDLRRARAEMTTREYANTPKWNFIVRPSFDKVRRVLLDLLEVAATSEISIDLDLETRAGHIACCGISWSLTEALCVPFMCIESAEGYWNEEEETWIVNHLRRLLTHSNARVRLQNGLYDAQYTYRHWHFIPNVAQDTMISSHSLFCALPKGLGYLASMHAKHYIYWKDEGKTWDKTTGEEQLWSYNCQDCIYTREVGESLTASAAKLNLDGVDAWQQRLFRPVLAAMIKGVRVIEPARQKLANEIQEELSRREQFLYDIIGHSINVASPIQMQSLFYEDLAQKPILKRTVIKGQTRMRPTCDDEALQKISRREPLLKPITNAISDIRTLGKWLNDFVLMKADQDGRMRTSFNIAGDAGGKSAPYSYRLSSSQNAFGSGGNLQTIPSEKSKSAGKAAARGSMDFALPNIRAMYGPDSGYTFFDLDLDRADLQVVVWESGDPMLKAALKMGADIHLLNVYALDGVEPPPLEELCENHPRYPDHRGPRKHKREFSKVFVHATNYGSSAKTCAEHTGRTISEIDRAQKHWFSMHPGIKQWHKDVEAQITKRHYVENHWGYRWYIFDRIEGLLPEALAWGPQSTVGILINRIWISLYEYFKFTDVQVLLQVHDSLAGQLLTNKKDELVKKIIELARIPIPYDDPLVIPVGIGTSELSWGHCG